MSVFTSLFGGMDFSGKHVPKKPARTGNQKKLAAVRARMKTGRESKSSMAALRRKEIALSVSER